MSLPIVTSENYFSTECNMAYMGHSQFLAFDRCEAAALAEAKGEYIRPWSMAFLTGGYVDAYFSGELNEFLAAHPECFTKSGKLKSEFNQANEVICRMQSDKLYMMLMAGRKQVIKTGTIAGVPFKIKIDSLLDAHQAQAIVDEFPETAEALGMCDGAIVDQKYMKDTALIWSEEEHMRVPFPDAYGYTFEGAIYQAIEGNDLPFILAVGTKEDQPDLDASYIPEGELAACLAEVEDRAPRYQAIKEGKIQPKRCGHCPYCRMTKKLSRIRDYREMEGDQA